MIRFLTPEWWILAPLLLDRRLRLAAAAPLAAAAACSASCCSCWCSSSRKSAGSAKASICGCSSIARPPPPTAWPPASANGRRSSNAPKSADDRLFYVDYADVPVVRAEGTGDYSDTIQATRTRLAIRIRALANAAATGPPACSCSPTASAPSRLPTSASAWSARGSALDYRLVTPPDATDYGITGLRLPARSQPGEPFIIELDVAGTPDGVGPFPGHARRPGAQIRRGRRCATAGASPGSRTGLPPAARTGTRSSSRPPSMRARAIIRPRTGRKSSAARGCCW